MQVELGCRVGTQVDEYIKTKKQNSSLRVDRNQEFKFKFSRFVQCDMFFQETGVIFGMWRILTLCKFAWTGSYPNTGQVTPTCYTKDHILQNTVVQTFLCFFFLELLVLSGSENKKTYTISLFGLQACLTLYDNCLVSRMQILSF